MLRKLTATAATIALATTLAATPAHATADSAGSPTTELTSNSQATQQDISQTVFYDVAHRSFGIDHKQATSLGYTEEEIATFENNLASIPTLEARELAEVIGLDVQGLEEQRVIPAVIWGIAAVIGGSAADELISQVTNWGIDSACRNLEGRWGAFDSFCRSNGHI